MAEFSIPRDAQGNERAAYRVLAEKGFFGPDCHLYKEGDALVFDGEPNEEMEPLNDLARERIEALYQRLDDKAREVAKANGRAFTERPRDIEGALEIATIDAKRVQLKKGDGGVPLMGATIGRDQAQLLEPSAIPETGMQQKRGPGRPKKGTGTLSLAG